MFTDVNYGLRFADYILLMPTRYYGIDLNSNEDVFGMLKPYSLWGGVLLDSTLS